MAYQLEEINRKLRTDPAAFVAECDGVYQTRLESAADRILERMKQSPIVLLSGPSGSGKTTTALKLEQELERRGVNTHTISMDNYFKTLDRRTAPRNAEGDIDYESPRLLDMDLLDDTFTKLSHGEWVVVPKFEFARQMRNDSRGTPLKLGENEIAIFEGIHALNDDIAGRHPEATTLYIRPLQHSGGGGAAVQGHLDAHLPPGRPGLQFPGHGPGGDPLHVVQCPPGRKAPHLPLQGPGQCSH